MERIPSVRASLGLRLNYNCSRGRHKRSCWLLVVTQIRHKFLKSTPHKPLRYPISPSTCGYQEAGEQHAEGFFFWCYFQFHERNFHWLDCGSSIQGCICCVQEWVSNSPMVHQHLLCSAPRQVLLSPWTLLMWTKSDGKAKWRPERIHRFVTRHLKTKITFPDNVVQSLHVTELPADTCGIFRKDGRMRSRPWAGMQHTNYFRVNMSSSAS